MPIKKNQLYTSLWQHLRAELNREPLGHEDWEY